MHRDIYLRKYTSLRKQAEAKLALGEIPTGLNASDDIDAMRHEMAVQHIELEMQHDELLQAHHALTELRLQAEHLRSRYQNFFNLTPAGMLVLTVRGNITECNLAFAQITGQPPGNVPGRTLAEFVSPDDRMNFDILFKQEIQHPSGRQIAIRLLSKQGAETPVTLSITTLSPDAGDQEAYLVTAIKRLA